MPVNGHTLDDALQAVGVMQSRVRGSFSIVAALMLDGKPTMIVVRDPNGIRPAVVGRREDGSWIAIQLPSSRRPTTAGRMPFGSRTTIMVGFPSSINAATIEKEPRTRDCITPTACKASSRVCPLTGILSMTLCRRWG